MKGLGTTSDFAAHTMTIHTPAEHQIGNNTLDLEVHIIHDDKAKSGEVVSTTSKYIAYDYAAHSSLSLLFNVTNPDVSSTSDVGKKAAEFLTAASSSTTAASTTIDKLNTLLQAVNWNTRFSYFGSLTRPPCTTGVQYNILGTVLPIDQATLDSIRT